MEVVIPNRQQPPSAYSISPKLSNTVTRMCAQGWSVYSSALQVLKVGGLSMVISVVTRDVLWVWPSLLIPYLARRASLSSHPSGCSTPLMGAWGSSNNREGVASPNCLLAHG
jgi:hypothetical protein